MPRFDADWIDSMLRPERRGSPPADRILTQIGVPTGAIVADIGCGPGFLSIPAARLTGPSGRVYAVDVEPKMLDIVERRAAEDGLSWLEIRHSTGLAIPVDDGIADLTLCALVLHDLDDPLPLARELHRVTRSSGRIAIVEWTPEPNAPPSNRIGPAALAQMLREIGRTPGETVHLSARQYLVVAN